MSAEDGYTPLFITAQNGDAEETRVLLDGGADANKARTDTGCTPLFIAAQNGHVKVVRVLLGGGADANKASTDNGCTPLFTAAQKGHVEVMRVLLDGGADANKAAVGDATPLCMAAHEGKLEAVRALLFNGADPNKATESGATPLDVASRNGHYTVALILLKRGAVQTACCVRGANAAGVNDPRMLQLLARWRCAMCDRRLCKVRVCARCKLVSYCGRECQRGDWARHKAACAEKASGGVPAHRMPIGSIGRLPGGGPPGPHSGGLVRPNYGLVYGSRMVRSSSP